MQGNFLSRAWKGQAGKMFYLGCWLPLLWIIGALCLGLAWHTYPKGYRMPDHDISYLGHPILNPRGWWYWSLGMGISSVMMYPPIAYASRRMKELTCTLDDGTKRLVTLGSICVLVSCAGSMGLALTPQGPKLDAVHKAAGACAFSGMYVTLLYFWGLPLFRLRTISAARLTLFVLSAWWAVVGFLVTQGYRFFALGELEHSAHEKHESLFLRFSFWEWMLFFGVTASFAVLVAVLPAPKRK
jgi:hypothetical protein